MIQGAHIYDSNQEQKFVEELRAVCHNSPFNVTVFHPFFIFFDQFLMVFPTTIQCVRYDFNLKMNNDTEKTKRGHS